MESSWNWCRCRCWCTSRYEIPAILFLFLLNNQSSPSNWVVQSPSPSPSLAGGMFTFSWRDATCCRIFQVAGRVVEISCSSCRNATWSHPWRQGHVFTSSGRHSLLSTHPLCWEMELLFCAADTDGRTWCVWNGRMSLVPDLTLFC